MANDDGGGTLRTVAWSEIFPWLNLFRCFRLAIGWGGPLVLSAVAILLTVSGWTVLGNVFSGDPQIEEEFGLSEGSLWQSITELVPEQPAVPELSELLPGSSSGAAETGEPSAGVGQERNPFWGSFKLLSRPFRQVFDSGVTLSKAAFLLLCGVWTLVVWAFFGGAITRRAAVALASEERVGWGAMLRYAGTKWRAYLAAPLFPLAGVLLGAAFISLLGLLLWTNVGLLLTALVWPLVLLGGLFAALILLGLGFGWPLMWATISAEGTDSFDGLARSYSYVFQRPLHYLFYAVVAVLFGLLGWLLVSNFAAAVISLSYWAVDWGDWGDPEFLMLIDGQFQLMPGGDDPQHVGVFGAGLIEFWVLFVKMLAVGFLYSYFWTASTAIYFLLRRDADATEMDEVFLEDDEEEQTYGLPPLGTDEAGAPVVADETLPPGKPTDAPGEEADSPDSDADAPSDE